MPRMQRIPNVDVLLSGGEVQPRVGQMDWLVWLRGSYCRYTRTTSSRLLLCAVIDPYSAVHEWLLMTVGDGEYCGKNRVGSASLLR